MTVKELVAMLTKDMEECPWISDCKVTMVGYDEDGHRCLATPVTEVTHAQDSGITRLWDF